MARARNISKKPVKKEKELRTRLLSPRTVLHEESKRPIIDASVSPC
jgi:hypothetical protein